MFLFTVNINIKNKFFNFALQCILLSATVGQQLPVLGEILVVLY